ncbi:MAG: TetR/AcrR family transcriptional regulator [Anaerolineales bacterium]|nr:MAG: TetR/AcrR family transcriptional regulator [Anaerolineales bacterium]
MQKSDILQAAAQIFRRKGYHAASMQDIADAVHLQKASLYHHVTGKQDILLAILDKALDLLIDDLQHVVDSDLTPEEKIRRAMQIYIERLTEDTSLAAVLLLEYRSLEPDLRVRHIERRDRYDHLWRGLIREGVEANLFRPVDEAVATFALLGVQNWMITWFRQDGRFTARQLADQFCDLFINGLRVREEADSP